MGRKEKEGKIRKILKERKVDVAVFQETKKSQISEVEVRTSWTRDKMEFMAMDAEGLAGGLLCIWDPDIFQMSECCSNRRFIIISGTFFHSIECTLLNIYAPNKVGTRGEFWGRLVNLKE